jgi:hypothetical protein
MAQVFRFPPPAAQEREALMLELRQLAKACNVTWEQLTAFACGKDKTWDDMPLDFLYGPVNILRAELEEQESKAAQAAQVQRAKVIPFASQAASPSAVTAPGSAKAEAHRRSMITKVHIALPVLYAKLPGFNEDTYRYILRERWGVDSSTKLDNGQLHELLLHLTDIGRDVLRGKIRRGSPDKKPATLEYDGSGLGREALMGKIEAMLAEKGAAEGTDMPWGYAVAILKRQTANDPGGQIRRFEDALPEHLSAVIAALYRDAKRKGRRTV